MYNRNIIYHLCQYIYVFYAKNFFCMNRQYLFRGFWSREAFFDKTTEMFADLRSGCGRAASLADLRSGCGRAASLADLRSGCGRTASLSPTAFPTKVNCYSSCFPLHRGSSKGPSPGKTPGVGPFLFIGKMPSLLFCHVGLSQSLRCNVLRLHCPAGSCKRPCSGPACRWHRLCNSSRCRPSPRTASSAHRHCRR